MQHIKRLLIVIVIILFSGVSYAETNSKILAISSYGTDYDWSNSIIDNISIKLKESNINADIHVEYLSSERFTSTADWAARVASFLKHHEGDNIKAIVLISDEAWMAYRAVVNEKFKDTPLVLCGVKPHSISLDDYDNHYLDLSIDQFSETLDVIKEYNATAVLREINTSGYIDLMLDVMPSIDRFTLITDNRFYGIYTKLMFEKETTSKYHNYPVEFIDSRFVNTDSLLARLPLITKHTGVLLTSWLTGKEGFMYSRNYVYGEMTDKMQTPVFITTDIGIEQGWFIGGCFNDTSIWGQETGIMLIDILKGRSPIDISPLLYRDEQININADVLSKFNLSRDKLPENTIYINDHISIFKQYRVYIAITSCILIIIFICALYIIKSNIRLKKAQKRAQQVMVNLGIANKELQETKKELIIALRKAEEADRLKSSFIVNIGTQIRNPLNAIVGFSGIIGIMEDKKEREDIAILIKQNSDILSQLIASILDISLLESRTVVFNYEETNINGLCADLVTTHQSSCPQNINIVLVCPEISTTIITDRKRLTQALSNLLGNAIKFTSSGTIEIGYISYKNDKVEFYVKDSGIGIPSDKLETIFDSFIKVNPYIAGAGLGLTITKNIIEIFEGEIGVSSILGEGSRFWFRIISQNKYS